MGENGTYSLILPFSLLNTQLTDTHIHTHRHWGSEAQDEAQLTAGMSCTALLTFLAVEINYLRLLWQENTPVTQIVWFFVLNNNDSGDVGASPFLMAQDKNCSCPQRYTCPKLCYYGKLGKGRKHSYQQFPPQPWSWTQGFPLSCKSHNYDSQGQQTHTKPVGMEGNAISVII